MFKSMSILRALVMRWPTWPPHRSVTSVLYHIFFCTWWKGHIIFWKIALYIITKWDSSDILGENVSVREESLWRTPAGVYGWAPHKPQQKRQMFESIPVQCFDVVFARHKRRESQIETNPRSALTLHAWFHIPWYSRHRHNWVRTTG